MIVLDRVPLEDIERVWPFVEAYIKAGIDAVTTSETAKNIKAEMLADRRTLWVVLDTENPFPFLAAFSVGFRDTNRGRVFFVDALGGRERERWFDQCLAELEDQARAAGMHKAEFEGRKGWERVLAKHGYRVARVVVEKVL